MSAMTLPRSRPAVLHCTTIRRCAFSRRIWLGPVVAVTVRDHGERHLGALWRLDEQSAQRAQCCCETARRAGPPGRSAWFRLLPAIPRARSARFRAVRSSAPPGGRSAPQRRGRCGSGPAGSASAVRRRRPPPRAPRRIACSISFAVVRRRFEIGAEHFDRDLGLDARQNVIEAVRDRLADVERHSLERTQDSPGRPPGPPRGSAWRARARRRSRCCAPPPHGRRARRVPSAGRWR